jgi:Skp family chaperone for outer membrane proteins
MRNLGRVATSILFLAAWPALAWGQAASAPSHAYKIGVVNIQQVIAETAEGKEAFAQLRKKYAPRQEDLQKQQQAVEDLRNQIQRQATTLSESERLRLGRELAEKQKLYSRAAEDAQSDFQDDRQDVITRIGQKMVQVIDEYAKENGYELVLDAQIPVYSESQSLTGQLQVYYAGPGVDISKEIVTRYDAQFPVSAAGGASAGGASKATPSKAPAHRPTGKPPR